MESDGPFGRNRQAGLGQPITIARAFAIHVFTACGAALALLAMVLATGGHWAGMFFCLGMALVVDGVDGPLAREFKVAETLPRWSGETLDLIVDFTTYVFVPAYAIAASGQLPHALAIPAAILVVITGALYFADRQMKTADNYFRGFPAAWNLVAFYLYLLEPPPWLGAATVIVLAALSFAPIRFVHPLRVQHLRSLNIALMAAWSVLAVLAVVHDLNPGPYVTWPLVAIAVYFFAGGLLRRPG
ncbi:MAG: CDP-alcohol phosphatidyltransferase family protein [Pseudolabrys sp.]